MKTLNDIINAVQHETQLPRYKISLKIGKSKNYLSEVLRSGVSPKKEQEIINLLLNLVDDEMEMLRNVLADKEKTIESLAKAGHATGKKLNKEVTKNRILTASIIGLVAIFSVYTLLK